MKTIALIFAAFFLGSSWALDNTDLDTMSFGARIRVPKAEAGRMHLLTLASAKCRRMGLIKATKYHARSAGNSIVIHTVRCLGTDEAIAKALRDYDALEGPEFEATKPTSQLAKDRPGQPHSSR